jgi:hypothetical protein
MLNNGTLVSLLSDCQVHDIDRINPNTTALSIMPSPYTNKKETGVQRLPRLFKIWLMRYRDELLKAWILRSLNAG